MGYSTSNELVLRSEALLSAMHERIAKGQPYILPIPQDLNISQEYYEVRRILAAAARHRTPFAGKYAYLSKAVRVKINQDTHALDISPKDRTARYASAGAVELTPISEQTHEDAMALVKLAPDGKNIAYVRSSPEDEWRESSWTKAQREGSENRTSQTGRYTKMFKPYVETDE